MEKGDMVGLKSVKGLFSLNLNGCKLKGQMRTALEQKKEPSTLAACKESTMFMKNLPYILWIQ